MSALGHIFFVQAQSLIVDAKTTRVNQCDKIKLATSALTFPEATPDFNAAVAEFIQFVGEDPHGAASRFDDFLCDWLKEHYPVEDPASDNSTDLFSYDWQARADLQ